MRAFHLERLKKSNGHATIDAETFRRLLATEMDCMRQQLLSVVEDTSARMAKSYVQKLNCPPSGTVEQEFATCSEFENFIDTIPHPLGAPEELAFSSAGKVTSTQHEVAATWVSPTSSTDVAARREMLQSQGTVVFEGNQRPNAKGGGRNSIVTKDLWDMVSLFQETDVLSDDPEPTCLRERVAQYMKSGRFDYVFSFFVCASAIVVGIDANMTASHSDENEMKPIIWCDWFFTAIFVLETSLRIWVLRMEFLTLPECRGWNIFDLVIVLSSLIMPVSSAFNDVSDDGGLRSFTFVRLFRLCRLLRLVRIVRLVPELEAIVYLVTASMSSCLWTSFLLVVIVYIVSIYFTDALAAIESEDPDALHLRWGSIFASMLSLFSAVTGGESWRNLVWTWENSNMAEAYKAGNTIVFCCYVVFTELVILNLVTGVFVDGARHLVERDKRHADMQHSLDLFRSADLDQSDSVSFRRLVDTVDPVTLRKSLAGLGIRMDQLEDVFKMLDTSETGYLGMADFVHGLMCFRTPVSSLELGVLRKTVKELRDSVQEIKSGFVTASKHFCGCAVKSSQKLSPHRRASALD
eukprot:TRINITY_DN23878_c0_g1_i1.p1 TRINITY_DN23878_c0_g1~~TRINITY_DN23878_c0_g1_i1.p1  ORF type:complete len:579 (+),score=79.17 TRINITY_DN23878_c0_g1_i1:71-1807(+)